jgi:hydroxyacylglutathione hydrolase
MRIDRFEVPGLAQYSYVVSSHGEAAVIDAIRDFDRYVGYAEEHALRIRYVLETHIHADFAAGSAGLAEQTGAELALSAYDEGELYRYGMPHRALKDGEAVEFGSVRLEALHTPGHTPEHLSFLLYDKERSADRPMVLFSGDFLFVGSMGRPDLLGEGREQGLAHELFRSVGERIAGLPDHLQMYPGHGAGSLCGAGMGERAESTLGYERAVNPLFRLGEEAFVAEILGSVPEMPAYYPRMKALNSVGAAALEAGHGRRALPAAAVAGLAQREDVVLLDVRQPEAFGGAHIPGSIHIGAGPNLVLWAGWLLDPAKRIVLIGEQGDEEEEVRRSLLRVGLDRIEGFLAGGFGAWVDAGRELARTTQLSTREVAEGAKAGLVLDVRSEAEWKTGHIEGAQHIPLGTLQARVNEIVQRNGVTAVCGSGYRSSIAASLLERSGFGDVRSMNGGMGAWHRQRLPVTMP